MKNVKQGDTKCVEVCAWKWPLGRPRSMWKDVIKSIYRVSQEERTKLGEGVPYVKLYRYNPKHLCPKLNGY